MRWTVPSQYVVPVGPKPPINAILDSEDDSEAHDANGDGLADCPEVSFGPSRIDDPKEIHSEIGCEEREGKHTIVTTVNMRMALLFDSAIISCSFCSIVRD